MRRLYEKIVLMIVLLLMSSVILFFLFYKPRDIISETEVVRCYVIEKTIESDRDNPLESDRDNPLGFVNCKNGDVIRFENSTSIRGVRLNTLYNFVVKINIEDGTKNFIELE